MTGDKDDMDASLNRLKRVDHWCDLYEAALQKGVRLTPSEFLTSQGAETSENIDELLGELKKLEDAYQVTWNEPPRNETQPFTPIPSKRVGRYELRRPLGSGGFGEVWVAFDPQLAREIAIKIPHRGVLADAASVERFYREARSAAKLKHANIVRVHDAGSDGSTHFIAAEFIAGKTLRELCSADGMEIREAVRIISELASAVYYAHRNQIVHRDIKPGNVLMDANNQPHLTDFGLASQLDASALTTNGTVLGTPIYMAPEQAAGRFGAALPACDQYSLGTVFYELLTGRPPFSGSNSVVLYHKLNTAPPSPRSIRPEIPEEIEAICLKAMERIPEKRYSDCEAMAVELRNWMNGGQPKVEAIRKWWWLAAGVLVAIAAVFWIVVASTRREHMRTENSFVGSDPQSSGQNLKQDSSSAPTQKPPIAKNRGLPPTPENVEILDATFHLPLHPDRPRKVVDFIEIHGASFNTIEAWLKNLGPDYCPSVIGEHASATPSQFHAVAYRVNWPVPFRVDSARTVGEDSKTTIKHSEIGFHTFAYTEKLKGSGPDGEFIRVANSDVDYTWYTIGVDADFKSQMQDLRTRNYRPILIIPRYSFDQGRRMVMSVGAYDRRNWEAAEFLSIDKLKEFAERAKAEKRFLFQIRADVSKDDQPQFFAIALENSEERDWNFQCDMSTSEYESELLRQKMLGFRPTTVTSYGDPANPKYAAAWIRYFNPTPK